MLGLLKDNKISNNTFRFDSILFNIWFLLGSYLTDSNKLKKY